MNSVSCFERLDHHTDILALRQHRTIPWWPSRSFLSVSAWSTLGTALGTTIRCPCTSTPFPSVISPWASQYALTDWSSSLLSGHPSQQYLRIFWHTGIGSWDWAFLYVSSHWLLARKRETAAIPQNSAKSCRAMLSAHESVSAVYSSLLGTCVIS